MDSPIDETGAFRDAITVYMDGAKKQLTETDALEPVVLLGGPGSFIQVEIGEVPMPIVHVVVRDLCRAHRDLDYAIHISLAYTLKSKGPHVSAAEVSKHKDARLCIVVHASHRDLGLFAAHLPFERKAEKQFEFSEVEWPDVALITERTLDGIWPKRPLNS